MKKIVSFAAAAVMSCGFMAHSAVERNFETRPVTSPSIVDFKVDSIDYRKNLTRVYGSLTGRPHTSGRIDRVTLGGMECTDIDGIDLNRYYQWEDDGVILVEFDFPSMKPIREADIQFSTPRGESGVKVAAKAR